VEVVSVKPKKEKAKKSGIDWLISVFIKVVVKFFIYLTVYIMNFNKLKMHIFGFFMSVLSIIFIPNKYVNGCSTVEWIMFLIFTSFIFSGAVSGYVYAKFSRKTETTQVLHNENPQADRFDEQPPNDKNINSESNYTIEEGDEVIIPLENGGFRRIYRVRRG
jgi:hypothetical protein